MPPGRSRGGLRSNNRSPFPLQSPPVNILVFAPPSPDRDDIVAALPPEEGPGIIVESAAQASARLAHGGIDLVVLDLAAGDALRFLRRQPSQKGRAPVVCIADRRQPEASSEALRLGVVDIVGRPVQHAYLVAAMANAVEMSGVVEGAPVAVELPGPSGIFGASPGMRDVLGIVRRVAHSRCGVLIVGEQGTGREMIARAIHAQGALHAAPFAKFACGDASADAFEGLLREVSAGAGTLFLDDVCELPLDFQVRVEAAQAAPVRLLASAQPRFDNLVARGRIRRSLAGALGVVRIDVPPLRQRAQDVPMLALHFLKDACSRNDVAPKTFSRSALALLSSLPWRGNAGELRSLTERLAVLVPRGVVLLEDVLASVRFDGAEAVGRTRGTLRDARARFERDYVASVLEHHKGRMGAAAKELGIERTNLYRKIKLLNIRWSIPD